MGFLARGRGVFAAFLIVVLAAGSMTSSPIGWAQDATPDIDTLDEICATLEASPDASPTNPASPEVSPGAGDATTIGTPESDTAGTDLALDASPAAEIEAELCGTPD